MRTWILIKVMQQMKGKFDKKKYGGLVGTGTYSDKIPKNTILSDLPQIQFDEDAARGAADVFDRCRA
jgi:hypothetical protein